MGNELRQLDNELKKVMAYANDKKLTPAIVERVVGNVRERDIFEMIDAVGTGNLIEAVRMFCVNCWLKGKPLKIFGAPGPTISTFVENESVPDRAKISLSLSDCS